MDNNEKKNKKSGWKILDDEFLSHVNNKDIEAVFSLLATKPRDVDSEVVALSSVQVKPSQANLAVTRELNKGLANKTMWLLHFQIPPPCEVD